MGERWRSSLSKNRDWAHDTYHFAAGAMHANARAWQGTDPAGKPSGAPVYPISRHSFLLELTKVESDFLSKNFKSEALHYKDRPFRKGLECKK